MNLRVRAAAIGSRIQVLMARKSTIFDEQYRVVAIEGDHLVIRGVLSGDVLTIVNPQPGAPLTEKEYPPGKLIALIRSSSI